MPHYLRTALGSLALLPEDHDLRFSKPKGVCKNEVISSQNWSLGPG